MATASFSTGTGTVTNRAARAPELEKDGLITVVPVLDTPPQGARHEDFDEAMLRDAVKMFEGACGNYARALFDEKVAGEGSAWRAHGQSCAALHGVTSTAFNHQRLADNWIKAAKSALQACEAMS